MPLEIASSPVRDEPPLAKERNTMKSDAPYSQPSPGVPSGTTPGACRSACGSSPQSAHRRDEEDQAHRGGEEVGGQREHPARLAHSAQIPVPQQHDHQQGDGHLEVVQPRPAVADEMSEETSALVPADTWTATVTT